MGGAPPVYSGRSPSNRNRPLGTAPRPPSYWCLQSTPTRYMNGRALAAAPCTAAGAAAVPQNGRGWCLTLARLSANISLRLYPRLGRSQRPWRKWINFLRGYFPSCECAGAPGRKHERPGWPQQRRANDAAALLYRFGLSSDFSARLGNVGPGTAAVPGATGPLCRGAANGPGYGGGARAAP
jgi:hypothetical protein